MVCAGTRSRPTTHYIYILFSFFSSTLSPCLPPPLCFFVFLLFLSLAARTGFLATRYKGGVTSDAPRKFISRFNAAALLALIYIHSPKPRTTSGARLVSSPERTLLSTGLSCKSLNTWRRIAATNVPSPTRLIKTDGACRGYY